MQGAQKAEVGKERAGMKVTERHRHEAGGRNKKLVLNVLHLPKFTRLVGFGLAWGGILRSLFSTSSRMWVLQDSWRA